MCKEYYLVYIGVARKLSYLALESTLSGVIVWFPDPSFLPHTLFPLVVEKRKKGSGVQTNQE